MTLQARVLFALVLAGMAGGCSSSRAHWPQWRGPQGDGVSASERAPLEWTAEEGVAWLRHVPGWGTSTPAVWGNAVFVTSQDGSSLLLHRLDWRDGSTVWTRAIGKGDAGRMDIRAKTGDERRQQKFHHDHNLASPSPIVDGERVIAHFGNGDLVSYRFDGTFEWKRNLQVECGAYTIWWGHANSPVFFEDLVISVCMQDSLADLQDERAPSYVVAHDKRTGNEIWRTSRMTGAESEPCDAYTTPIFRQGEAGAELVVMGGTWLDAYDPRSGARRWHLPGLGGNRVITGPVAGGDLVYATVGMKGPLLAVRPTGAGELDEDVIAWQHDDGTPDSPSPVISGGLIFIVSDGGIARCLDAATGATRWTERIEGTYRASPVVAQGRVYFVSMEGRTTVVRAAPEFEALARNELDDEFIASPVIADGRLLLRGKRTLWAIDGK